MNSIEISCDNQLISRSIKSIREINQSVKMADEMKSTNIAVGEEAVETSKMEMDTQSGK